MKNILVSSVLFLLSAGVNAQALEFNFASAVPVGCSNAKPITDGVKKITVDLATGNAVFSMQSLNCKKDIKAENLGVVNESSKATAYFDEKSEKGIIIEANEKAVVFEKNLNAYVVTGVGHVDKKIAKTLSIETEKTTYNSVLADIPNLITKAKTRKKQAEMAAKMAKLPETEYKDEYDISGIYYLSRTIHDPKNDKYVNAINFQFIVAENKALLHYHEGLKNEVFIEGIYRKALQAKSLSYLYFMGDNMNSLEPFANEIFMPIEKDVYYVSGDQFGTDTRLDCSSVKLNTNKDANGNIIRDYLIIGKDKKRVEELNNNPELLEKLLIKSCIEMCEAYNVVRAGRNPMPGEGRVDEKLASEAFELTKKHAASKNWPQKLEYCYIKSPEWVIIRHKVTGVILSRSTRVVVIMTSNGKCMWEEMEIRQDYDGAQYGKTYFYGNSGNIVPAECTDAMKKKK
ncbi:MAG: hypothetical protein ACK40M_03515 [Flavobacteriales bacterium]